MKQDEAIHAQGSYLAPIIALVGMTAYLVGSTLAHTSFGEGDSVGRSLVLLPGFLGLWRFLFFAASVALVVIASFRIYSRSQHRFESGILLGVGGLLLLEFLREILPIWLASSPNGQPQPGGYARLSGALLILVAGLRSLVHEKTIPRSSPMQPPLYVVGGLAIAAAQLVPFTSRAGVGSETSVDLGTAWEAIVSARFLNRDVIGLLGALIVVALAVLILVSAEARIGIRGALFGIGILEVAVALQGFRAAMASPSSGLGPGVYLLLGGGLLITVASALGPLRKPS